MNYIIFFIFQVIIVLTIYYQFDENLDPEVRAAIDYHPKQIPNEQNAYISMLGIYASHASSPFQHGSSIIKNAELNYERNNLTAIMVSIEDTPNIFKMDVYSSDDSICRMPDKSCLSTVRKNRKKIVNVLSKNRVLLNRLDSIYDYQQFQESKYFLGFSQIIILHRTYLASLALSWLEGNKLQTISSVNRSIQFWRMVSKSEVSLLTRMIAIANLGYSYELLSEFIADCGKCESYYGSILGILKPVISKEELSMRKVTRREFLEIRRLTEIELNKALDLNSFLVVVYHMIFKKNSMDNKLFSVYNNMALLSECSLKSIISCHSEHIDRNNQKIKFLSLGFADDPLGTIVSEIARPAYISYPWTMFRIEAKRRLLIIKLQLGMNEININEIDEFLSRLPKELKSPFSGTNIEFKKGKNQLQIDCGKEIDEVLSVSL